MPTSTIRRQLSFGGRVHPEIGLLIALTAACSIAAALMGDSSLSPGYWLPLVPQLVLRGQAWRLVTAVFIEGDPISLIFSCLMLYWFGRDLAGLWGARGFVWRYLGVALAAYGLTTLLSLVWPSLRTLAWSGNWPVTEAMIIAWAVAFPGRQILVFFVAPMGGRALIYMTVGLVALFAVFARGGWVMFLPHAFAIAIALVATGVVLPQRLYWNLKNRLRQARAHRRARGKLRVVRGGDDPGKPKLWN